MGMCEKTKNMREKLNIRAERNFPTWSDFNIRLYGIKGIEPYVTITNQEAQVLFDDLWKAGIRPTKEIIKPGLIEKKG